jgi:hypothetical protein
MKKIPKREYIEVFYTYKFYLADTVIKSYLFTHVFP